MSESPGDVTQLLRAWRNGDQAAYDALLPLVYDELRRIAHRLLPRSEGMLQPTALVHEAYLSLIDETQVEWQDRAHFYAIAANTMSRILVDEYRRGIAQKRGGQAVFVSLSQAQGIVASPVVNVEALHQALQRLAVLSPRQAQISELKIFTGLPNEAVATLLGISLATVKREWRTARAWLYAELT